MTTTKKHNTHKTVWQEPLKGYEDITRQGIRELRKLTPQQDINIWENLMRHPIRWKKL